MKAIAELVAGGGCLGAAASLMTGDITKGVMVGLLLVTGCLLVAISVNEDDA